MDYIEAQNILKNQALFEDQPEIISEAEKVTRPFSEAEKITPPLSEADKNKEEVHLTDIFESEEQEVEQTAHKIR